ncbi:MAG TPA: hypothetical protein RMH99_12325 [Sandaracinaceae bacterium LLY-WYZ-13_1]|nr:hypothetical protein [Sandaracinaceae bacterium LLY-WYZ-13_1]
MTHRDELLALKARLEAQERAVDEARSENELLRAAHAQKTRELETLRRELHSLRDGDDVGEPDASHDPDGTTEEADGWRGGGRSLHLVVAAAVGLGLIGSMMLALAASRHARYHRVPLAHAAPSTAAPVTPLVREGTVVSTSGPEVVQVGQTCTVERMPAYAGRFDCRIEVRCGEQTLYGADPHAGYVRCGGREVMRDSHMSAIDGDPAMTLDLARSTVTLQERVGLGTQRVTIEL